MVFERIRGLLWGDDEEREYPDHEEGLTKEQVRREIAEMQAGAGEEATDPDRAAAAAEAVDPGEATAGAGDEWDGVPEEAAERDEPAADLDLTVPTDRGGAMLVEAGERTALVGAFDGVSGWLDEVDADPDRFFALGENLSDPAGTGALEVVGETDADHVLPYTWGVDDDADLERRDETQRDDEFRRYVAALRESGTDYTVQGRDDDAVAVAPGVVVDRPGGGPLGPGEAGHGQTAVVRRTGADETFEAVVTTDPRGGVDGSVVEQTAGRDDGPGLSPVVAAPDVVVTGDRGEDRATPLSTDLTGATSVVAGGETLYAQHLDALADAGVDGVADAASGPVSVAVDDDGVTADGLLAPAVAERERYEGRDGQDGQGDPGGVGDAGVSLSHGGDGETESVDRDREAEPETEQTVDPAEGNWLAADGEALFERAEPEETVGEEESLGLGL